MPIQRLSVKANLKLARVYLERQEWTKLKSVSENYASSSHFEKLEVIVLIWCSIDQLLKDLHEACAVESTGSGTSAEDQTKASMRK